MAISWRLFKITNQAKTVSFRIIYFATGLALGMTRFSIHRQFRTCIEFFSWFYLQTNSTLSMRNASKKAKVRFRVLNSIHDLKVLLRIVDLVMVFVVHNLFRSKFSSNNLLYDMSMFKNALVSYSYIPISITGYASFASAIVSCARRRFVSTKLGAMDALTPVDAGKWFSAVFTYPVFSTFSVLHFLGVSSQLGGVK